MCVRGCGLGGWMFVYVTCHANTLCYVIVLRKCCVFWQDFILEHYSEDSTRFQDEIDDLMDLRKVELTSKCIKHKVFLSLYPPAGDV